MEAKISPETCHSNCGKRIDNNAFSQSSAVSQIESKPQTPDILTTSKNNHVCLLSIVGYFMCCCTSPSPIPSPSLSPDSCLRVCSRSAVEAIESTRHSVILRRFGDMSLTSPSEVLSFFRSLEKNIEILFFDDDTMITIFASILSLQNGNKHFNEKLGQLGACELVIFIMQSLSISDIACRNKKHKEEILLNLLLIVKFLCVPGLSRDAQIKENIRKLGDVLYEGIKILIDVMNQHMESEQIAEEWSWVMIHLATNDSNRATIGSLGGCDTILKSLQLHESSESISEASCWAVKNIAFQSDENRSKFGCIGTCEAIAGLLAKHSGNAKVSKAVWGAIINLSCEHDENKVRFSRLGDQLGLGFMKY